MIKNKGACDLEYAKELRSLGCSQESIWYWSIIQRRKLEANLVYGRLPRKCDRKYISAPTCAELLESLPQNKVITFKWFNDWYCEAFNDVVTREIPYTRCVADTPANALAKLKIWLIRSGHIKVGEE